MPPLPAHEPLERPRQALVLTFVAVAAWYLHWRLGTLNPQAPVLSGLVYAAELCGFAGVLLHIFTTWRLSLREAPKPHGAPTVDVVVRCCDEPASRVRRTVLSALALQQPHTVWLRDEAGRPELESLAHDLGCRYRGPPEAPMAGSGRSPPALPGDGELIALFDADHAPRRDFLSRTLGYFGDPRLGFVQTPLDFADNGGDPHRHSHGQRVLQAGPSLFFRIVQRGRDRCNAALFCGSGVVVRRAALAEVGGFGAGLRDETLLTSIRLHARGWRSVYHAQPLVVGLTPASLAASIDRRRRRLRAAMGVWRHAHLLTRRGLTPAQRLLYLAPLLGAFDGWYRLVLWLLPVVVLLGGELPLQAGSADFLWHFLPCYLLGCWVLAELGRGHRRSLLLLPARMVHCVNSAWATLSWARARRARSAPAARHHLGIGRWVTLPAWLLLGFSLAAIALGTWPSLRHGSLPPAGLLAAAVWAGLHAFGAVGMLLATLPAPRQRRADVRFPVPLAAELSFRDGRRVHGTVGDLSEGGMRFYGRLPAAVNVGSRFSGHLLLPDGAQSLWGEVRSVLAHDAADATPRAIGCSFMLSTRGRHRLEAFLYASDLQWLIDGSSDQRHTPLSWLLPGRVPGPPPRPLAGRHWQAAQLRLHPGGPPSAALQAVPADASQPPLLLSPAALPTGPSLQLDLLSRTGLAPRGVMLEAVPLAGDVVGTGLLHAYLALPAPLPAPPAAATGDEAMATTLPAELVLHEATARPPDTRPVVTG